MLSKRSASSVVTCCVLWHIDIDAMNSESECTRVDSDNGTAKKSSRMMSVRELNRVLSCTPLVNTERKRRRNIVQGNDARRKSSRIANLSETQREKRKLVQKACYGNRKRKRVELESASNCDDTMADSDDTMANTNPVNVDANAVNADAERFRTAFVMTTQFHVCGVCGTDECSENLRKLDSECVAMVEASNLPALYSTVVNSLRGSDALYDEYLQNVETEFHCNGLLKDARYMCVDCYTVLKRGKIARKKKQHDVHSNVHSMDHINGASVSSSMVDLLGTSNDDEYDEVLPCTPSANQAMNELEPESMVIDEMEATAMREMEVEEVSGETSAETGDSPDDEGKSDVLPH